jgi:hypothetical protein
LYPTDPVLTGADRYRDLTDWRAYDGLARVKTRPSKSRLPAEVLVPIDGRGTRVGVWYDGLQDTERLVLQLLLDSGLRHVDDPVDFVNSFRPSRKV